MILAESEYSLQQYVEVGQLLLDEEKFAEAIALYEAALKLYPESPAIYQALGFAQEKANDAPAGIASYRKALTLDPLSAIWVYVALGKLLSEENRWDEALALYQQGIAHHPDQGDLYRGLGLAQDRLANRAAAILSYQRAVQLKPEQPLWVYGTLGALLNQQQDWPALVQLHTQAIQIYPDQSDLYRELGFAQEQIADVAGEIQSYQQAIEIAVQPLWVYTTLIDLLSRQAEDHRAIESCLKGLAAYPDEGELVRRLQQLQQPHTPEALVPSLDCYWQQAASFEAQGQFAEAIEVYRKAIHDYPDRAVLHRALGMIQEKLGDSQAEIQSYQQAITLDPQQPVWVYSTLATLLAQQGQLDRAIALFERSLELYPQDIANLRQFSKVLMAHKRYSRAEEICRQTLGFKQKDPWIFKELAETQRKQGKIEDALDSIQIANQLLPNNCWLKWELASILLEQGDEPKAIRELYGVADDPAAPDWLKVLCFKALGDASKQDILQRNLFYYQAFRLDRNDPALKDSALELMKLLTADIADFYFRYHMWTEAQQMYRHLCLLNPNEPQSYYRLGNALEQTGDQAEALKAYELCSNLAPDNVVYLEKLGDLMSSYGKCYSFKELCFP